MTNKKPEKSGVYSAEENSSANSRECDWHRRDEVKPPPPGGCFEEAWVDRLGPGFLGASKQKKEGAGARHLNFRFVCTTPGLPKFSPLNDFSSVK